VISSYDGLPIVEHGGADAGYRSDLIRFPEQHFSTAVLCNLANTDPTALARQVADILLARELKPPASRERFRKGFRRRHDRRADGYHGGCLLGTRGR
jgi:predicted secreted protein